MKKNLLINTGIVVLIIVFALIVISTKGGTVEESVAKCIGQNSRLYVQTGCHACEIQKEMFGENYKFLNVVDCAVEKECSGITHTPTWVIDGKQYVGIQNIASLSNLTNCEVL